MMERSDSEVMAEPIGMRFTLKRRHEKAVPFQFGRMFQRYSDDSAKLSGTRPPSVQVFFTKLVKGLNFLIGACAFFPISPSKPQWYAIYLRG